MAQKKYRELDSGTWGGFQSSSYLAKMLNESQDSHMRGQIGRLHNSYCIRLNDCDCIPDATYRMVLKLIFDVFKKSVQSQCFPDRIESTILNLFNAIYKEKLRSRKIPRYRLLVTLNNKALTKNKIFYTGLFHHKNGGVEVNIDGQMIHIPFTDTTYFEEI